MKRYFLVGTALVTALLALTAFVASGPQAPAATVEVGSAVGGVNQIGRVGVLERLFSTGEGTNTDPITPKSITLVAGNAVVTGVPGQPTFAPVILRNAP